LGISDEARARLTNRVNRIVSDIDVYEAEKKDITRELTSNFYDHAMVHAQSRGSQTIEKQDIEAVFAESEDPREIAAGYMAAYLSGLRRAGIGSRAVAYVIDWIVLGIIMGIVIGMIFLSFWVFFPDQFNVNVFEPHYVLFVDPSGPVAILFSFIVATTTLIGLITYFIVIEGRFGATPGKFVMGLRVLREDGTKIGYVESVIRNIPKVVGNSVFLVIDALLMLLVFSKDKQRGFDKIARTIVVHKERQEA
jgi:uncharacterized RDD family membrane protein YckC/histone H3/H4